jgi:hypothetical protein
MTHVSDVGREFDAPVDVVWKFLSSGEPHARAHKSIRNLVATPAGENTVVGTMEWFWKGSWVKVATRLTAVPPVAVIVEQLEGPFAGSKSVAIYIPRGAKTGVDVHGEFLSPQIPASQVEAEARAWLGETFDEDAMAIREYAGPP